MSFQGVSLREYRCDCGRLLFRGLLFVSFIEIKCKRCSAIAEFKGLDVSDDGYTEYDLLLERKGVSILTHEARLRFWKSSSSPDVRCINDPTAPNTIEGGI